MIVPNSHYAYIVDDALNCVSYTKCYMGVRSKLLVEGKYLHLYISENISQPWLIFCTPNFKKYNRPCVKYKNVKVNLLPRAVKFCNPKYLSVANKILD